MTDDQSRVDTARSTDPFPPLGPSGRSPAVTGASMGAAVDRRQPADLAEILERVLNTGIVIAGEIRIDLLDIELLTIKLRLIVTSIDRAEEIGLDWWKGDGWYSATANDDPSIVDLVSSSDEDEEPTPGALEVDRADDRNDDQNKRTATKQQGAAKKKSATKKQAGAAKSTAKSSDKDVVIAESVVAKATRKKRRGST